MIDATPHAKKKKKKKKKGKKKEKKEIDKAPTKIE